jgi:hypothetical protein
MIEIASHLKYEFHPEGTILSELGKFISFKFLDEHNNKFYIMLSGVISVQCSSTMNINKS